MATGSKTFSYLSCIDSTTFVLLDILPLLETIRLRVSVSPTDGTGPTQGQRKTLTRAGIEPTTFGLDLRRSTD